MDNTPGVSEFKSTANSFGNVDCLVERKFVVERFLDKSFDIASTHIGHDDIRLSVNFSHVENGHDMGMVAEFAHCPGFAGDTFPGFFIKVFGLNQGEGDVSIEFLVMDEVGFFLAAFTEFFNNLVAVVDEGGRSG